MQYIVFLRGTVGSGKTVVSLKYKDMFPKVKLLEVDNIKLAKYGTTNKCIPEEDFCEVGKIAKYFLDKECNIMIIEPLVEKKHYDYIFKEIKKDTNNTYQLLHVWLTCKLDVAVQRKKYLLKEDIINFQFTRYDNRYKFMNELVIETDNLSIDEIVNLISRSLVKSKSTVISDLK